ncbi:MAG: hypothetical protein HKM04_09665 [Legionellales bacterium]|nr:hypothetical protein [Legionellales bacterium]
MALEEKKSYVAFFASPKLVEDASRCVNPLLSLKDIEKLQADKTALQAKIDQCSLQIASYEKKINEFIVGHDYEYERVAYRVNKSSYEEQERICMNQLVEINALLSGPPSEINQGLSEDSNEQGNEHQLSNPDPIHNPAQFICEMLPPPSNNTSSQNTHSPALTEISHQLDKHMKERLKKSKKQYIGIFDSSFGGCPLWQKQKAVDKLNNIIENLLNAPQKIHREEMFFFELAHNDAIIQGELGKLYKNSIKSSLCKIIKETVDNNERSTCYNNLSIVE